MNKRTFGRTLPPARQKTSKIPQTSLGNPSIASGPTPQTDPGKGGNRTQAFTHFTVVGGTQQLYSGDRLWAKVTLNLETAGPVAVGTDQQLTPVLSGKGQLLPTGQDRSFVIAKGSRLFIASTSINRVAVTVEPLPWLEQIAALLAQGTGSLAALVKKIVG